MNFTQVIDHKLETSCPSNGVPIVFVVEADFSIRDSLRLLIQCGGWQAEIFASASKFLPRRQLPIHAAWCSTFVFQMGTALSCKSVLQPSARVCRLSS